MNISKIRLLFVLLAGAMALALGGRIALANKCEDLKAAVKFELTETSVRVKAGEMLRIPFTVTAAESELSQWEVVALTGFVHNQVRGSKSLFEMHSLKENLPTSFEFKVAENMGEEYLLQVRIIARSDDFPFCNIAVSIDTFQVTVANSPDKIDISPPSLKNLSFRELSYDSQATLELVFDYEDKSRICRIADSQGGSCTLGSLAKFANLQDASKSFDLHIHTPVFQLSGDRYLALIPLVTLGQAPAPGSYKLTHLIIKDIHDNYSDLLVESEQPTVEIKKISSGNRTAGGEL